MADRHAPMRRPLSNSHTVGRSRIIAELTKSGCPASHLHKLEDERVTQQGGVWSATALTLRRRCLQFLNPICPSGNRRIFSKKAKFRQELVVVVFVTRNQLAPSNFLPYRQAVVSSFHPQGADLFSGLKLRIMFAAQPINAGMRAPPLSATDNLALPRPVARELGPRPGVRLI